MEFRRVVPGMRAAGGVIILLIFVCFAVGVYFFFSRVPTFPSIGPLRQARIDLLCRTDHQTLLDACRELAGREASGELKAKTYHVYPPPAPEVSTFPQAILNLKPSTVTISPGGVVMVAVAGGLDHFGVIAYPEGIEDIAPPPGVEWGAYGDRQLLDGLWYYDDGYENNPKYDKKISAWMERYKKE